VDNPEQIQIRAVEGEQIIVFELRVHPGDFGKIIGRQGQMIKSIRRIMASVCTKLGRRITLEIIA